MSYFGMSTTGRQIPRIQLGAFLLMTGLLIIATVLILAFRMPVPVDTSSHAKSSSVVEATPIDVLVARETVWPGQKLNDSMFKRTPRVVTGIDGQVISEYAAIQNSYATSFIEGDSVLLKSAVTFTPPSNALTARIPPGFRAVTIPVNAESGIEGWVRPGVRVDVLWVTTNRDRQIVSTIVENAQVLSAERTVENLSGTNQIKVPMPTHVTLLSTLKDAQRIQLAKTTGSLTLNLRGDRDDERAGSETISVDGLLKARDKASLEQTQGVVTVGGREFVLKAGGKLVPKEATNVGVAEK